MTPLLVLRPEPGASATARRIEAAGGRGIVAPLFETVAREWDAPDAAAFDAVLISSAATVRLGGDGLKRYVHLPAIVVGDASAAAARHAGFRDVRPGGGTIAAALDVARAMGAAKLFHPGGVHVTAADQRGLSIVETPVYEAVETPSPPAFDEPIRTGCVALVHSARAGAKLAALVAERGSVAVAAISPAALAAVGDGWRATVIASTPDDTALVAAALALVRNDRAMR